MKKLLMQVIVAAAAALSSTGAYALMDVPYITTSKAKENWLLLDYRPNQDTIIETTVAMPTEALAQNNNHALFCARGTTTSQNTFTFFFLYNTNKTQFRWDYSKTAIGTAYGEVAADTKYVITCNVEAETAGMRGFSVTAGDTTSRYAAYTPLTGFTAGNKLMLFASYKGATAVDPVATDNYATFKVFGVRIWDGAQTDDKLLFDLRPCVDEHGVYCLRDAKNPEHALYYSEGGNDFGGPTSLSISRSTLSATGEIKVFAKVDTLDGLAPCTLTAVVHDCVSGETTTNSLGVVEDAELHDYDLVGLAPDGEYELTVHGSWPNLGVDGLESDLFVFQVSAAADTARGKIYMISPDAELDGDPMDWLVVSSGLHRLPQDGDNVILGQTAGTYALNITNSVTRTFNAWTGAGAANVVSETTIGAGSTLNITNTTAYGGNKSGSKASFVVDGGTLHIKVNARDSMYGTDTLTIKNGGTFLRDGASGQTHSIVMTGTSRIYLQDGTFTITPASGQAPYNTLHFDGGTPAFIQTGGTASCGSLSFQQQYDNYYEISGGSMTLSGANGGIKHGNRSGSTKTCGTLRLRGSKFTFAAQDIGYAFSSSVRTLLPTFFDYRIRSDADPGTKGVGFIDYTATAVKGAIRAIPDGGVAIVHTNLFPLIVQRSKNALTFANDFKDNMASYRFMPTGLFDIGVPSGLAYMIRADLKPEAELADGWTSEEGVSAGFVKLPRIGNPSMLLKANLKLKVEPQGTKTLASIKSDLEAMGFGPVTADETAAYNLVVGLPKDRLAKRFSDSKVLVDFTTVTGAKAMQSNKVTTNALIKAVSLDIAKPGLVLMFY